jgi:hypothetical protein
VTAASRRAAASAALGWVERSGRDVIGDDTDNRDERDEDELGNVGRLECNCHTNNRSACDQKPLAKRTELEARSRGRMGERDWQQNTQLDCGSGGLVFVRTHYTIPLAQRLRLLCAAKRVERVGGYAGAVLGPGLVEAGGRLVDRERRLRES